MQKGVVKLQWHEVLCTFVHRRETTGEVKHNNTDINEDHLVFRLH